MTRRRVFYSPVLLAEIARVCVDAQGRQPASRAVATRFGLSITVARQMIGAARDAGLDVPEVSGKWRFTHPQFELACSCGWSCSLDVGMPGLQRHTLVAHGRNPSKSERVPQSARMVA